MWKFQYSCDNHGKHKKHPAIMDTTIDTLLINIRCNRNHRPDKNMNWSIRTDSLNNKKEFSALTIKPTTTQTSCEGPIPTSNWKSDGTPKPTSGNHKGIEP